jgi:hypothetical protein
VIKRPADLAGDEAGYPAALFELAFRLARDSGLPATVHAGEAAGPQSVWGALRLAPRPIGHGVRSAEDPRLLEHLGDAGITPEVALTSHVQTGAARGLAQHQLATLVSAGVLVALCTYNPAVSDTRLSRAYELAGFLLDTASLQAAGLGYGQVWGRLVAGLDGLCVAAPTASAITQARRRLSPGPLRELFALLRGPSPMGARWRGQLVAAVDGTIMAVADSDANLAVYSKQRGGPTGGGSYPALGPLALVSCGTRTVIDAVFGPVSGGETTYAAGHPPRRSASTPSPSSALLGDTWRPGGPRQKQRAGQRTSHLVGP